VVEIDAVEERYRSRISPVLPADADLDIAAGSPICDGCHLNQLADAFRVDRHERVEVDDASRRVPGKEP